MTLPKLQKPVDRFLRYLATERKCSVHTVSAYKKDLAKFVEFAGPEIRFSEVDHLLIRAFLSELFEKGLSKPSVARALASLRSIFKWLAREGKVFSAMDIVGTTSNNAAPRMGEM